MVIKNGALCPINQLHYLKDHVMHGRVSAGN